MNDQTIPEFLEFAFGKLKSDEFITVVAITPPKYGKNGKTPLFTGMTHVDIEAKLKRLQRSNYRDAGLFVTKGTSKVPGSWKKEDFHSLHLAVLDDIGTKVPFENVTVPASYVIESSPGNFQHHYVLDDPITDVARADRFERSYMNKNNTDMGIRGPMHLVRIPFGFHQKTGALVKLDAMSDIIFSPDELLEQFEVDWAPEIAVHNTPDLPKGNFDLSLIHDPVLTWLAENGLVKSAPNSQGWVNIDCPWHEEHTNAGGTDYNPLGVGDKPMDRGFKCFHSHKKDTRKFLDWVAEKGGPNCMPYDPIPFLQQNYCVIEDGSRIAAKYYMPSREWAIWDIQEFNLKFPQKIAAGANNRSVGVGKYFCEHPDTQRTRGTTYVPSGDLLIKTKNGLFYNMFTRPMHPTTNEVPQLFFDHCEYLIANESEREYFYDWLAMHVQHPGERLPGIVIVGGFGVGKSWLNAMFSQTLGDQNVSSASFKMLSSHQTYDNWLVDKQMIVIEEAKDVGDTGRYDVYENLKPLIDTSKISNFSANMKYGKIRKTDIYANFLIFTNHRDALIIPSGERRLFIIDGARTQRDYKYYEKIHAALGGYPCMEAARLWNWLKERTITHDLKKPAMTKAKKAMVQMSKSSVDELVEDAIDEMPGAICTQHQLQQFIASNMSKDELDMLGGSLIKQVAYKFRQLDYVSDDDPRWQLRIDGERFRPRILRDKDRVNEMFDRKNNRALREEMVKNGRAGQSSKIGLNVIPFKR